MLIARTHNIGLPTLLQVQPSKIPQALTGVTIHAYPAENNLGHNVVRRGAYGFAIAKLPGQGVTRFESEELLALQVQVHILLPTHT